MCGFAALPCGKPLAFRSHIRIRRGFAAGGVAAKNVEGSTESQRLSAREAAKPHNRSKAA